MRRWSSSLAATPGVWQGDPLGAHCMGLAIYDFLEQLQAKLQPGSAFEVSDAMHCRPHGTPYAWIIDDLTCVPYQYEAIAVIDWIMAEAPKHVLHCNMPKFHVWIMGRPDDNVSFVEALQARGVEHSYDGLRRLLGAPIGSPSFCVKPGGHLDSAVTQASARVNQIMQIDHAQVQLIPALCKTQVIVAAQWLRCKASRGDTGVNCSSSAC